ncbi:hypothetical protein [Rhizobium sp. NXC24]|uniref:hypothetical protein n=1 Tax=Rhizobium sp. NXC24 TaxID=2048897 RepID=UPI000CDF4CEA|nr:hypothetical protein [Rhizobium sp. NXC24]AVA23972.1 hypothetical protein NXC24_PB00039 [Rhizobium sp. NXC24]
MNKFTEGLNDRPKSSTIAQSGAGLPEGSGQPVQATEEEALRIRAKLTKERDLDRRNDADDLVEQLARPKHGTA